MDVEWDPAKARSNLKKHGISFSDAECVLYDPAAIWLEDVYAEGEQRFAIIGSDALDRVIVLSYTYRGDSVRLISARSATRRERKEYEKGIRL